MAKGDHIYMVTRLGPVPLEHHGIDIGDGSVIHLAPKSGSRIALRDNSGQFSVRKDTLVEFARGKPIRQVEYAFRLAIEQTIELAEGYVGRTGYHILDNNCEHFATYCATGKCGSRQIEFGESTVASFASASTKVFWLLSSKTVAHVATAATRGSLKPHPLSLAADGVEIAVMAGGCKAGLSADQSRRMASLGGSLTAAGVGCVLGGPAGAAAALALHCSSKYAAERVCQSVRKFLS